MALELTFCGQRTIRNGKAGLKEPSGVALARNGEGFWIASDNARKIFLLSLNGQVDDDRSLPLGDKGVEGLAVHPSDDVLFAVREEDRNELIKLDLRTKSVTNKRRLADMAGYDSVQEFFGGKKKNKGLEGVTWNDDTGTLFCLKEGEPGLLLEVTADLMTVRLRAQLDERNGFMNPDANGKKPDFSGICYDPTRKACWIVSDKAERLYLYDPVADRVVGHAALTYRKDGEKKRVKKAEGVVFDANSGLLHVVTDRKTKKKKDKKGKDSDKKNAGSKDVKLFTFGLGA